MTRQTRAFCPLFLGLIAAVASAQSPVALQERSIKSATMDAAAKQEANAFVKAAAVLLRSDDPAQVKKGREMYTKTFAKPEMNPAYRTAFASLAVPSLKEIVATEGTMQGINAIEAMKTFNCPDSLTALTEQSSPIKQKSPSLRLTAASGLAPTIRVTELNTAQADSLVKAIAGYIDRETDWMVLAYEIQALEVMSISPKTSREGQGVARVIEASAINALVTKIRKGTAPDDAIRVINRSLTLVLSEQFGATAPADMAALKKSLEPSLTALRDLAASPPTGADAALFVQAGRLAETLQKIKADGASGKPAARGAGPAKAPSSR